MSKPDLRRCAVYTRKSSEEGLEQNFNSLQAQREACEAFIKSQAGEGWILAPGHFDDGGISGGTMQRPALQRLLGEIAAGKIDVVVVYKVDRLTRSLGDFAKMVELFDAHKISFVAVTQQFNTTTSMGRLTLNVLLSFAQFEREVTGERIRDKIAASKRKGMWMGGQVPLGYNATGRELTINPEEAKLIRRIYERYLALKSVRLVKEELDAAGVKSKLRKYKGGTTGGGSMFAGAIYQVLRSPLYVGDIPHKDEAYRGLHKAIIDRAMWEKVQQSFKDQKARPRGPALVTEPSPLLGKLFDESGLALTPAHSKKNLTRRRYYISRCLRSSKGDRNQAWRLPAPLIEGVVASIACRTLTDKPIVLAAAKKHSGLSQQLVLEAAAAAAKGLAGPAKGGTLTALVNRIDLRSDCVTVKLSLEVERERVTLIAREAIQLKKRGVELKMILEGAPAAPAPDQTLLRATARGHRWLQALLAGKAGSIAELARREKIADRYVSRLMRLTFLSPEITTMVASGKQTPATLRALYRKVPLGWHEQWNAVMA